MSTPHPSLTEGPLGSSQPFGSVSPWAPSSLMVSGSSRAALVFPFAKAQPGQQMRVGPPPEEELPLSWAGLGWAGSGQAGFTAQMVPSPPPPGLSSSSPGVSQGGGSER